MIRLPKLMENRRARRGSRIGAFKVAPEVLENAAHMPHLEQRTATVRLVTEFVGGG